MARSGNKARLWGPGAQRIHFQDRLGPALRGDLPPRVVRERHGLWPPPDRSSQEGPVLNTMSAASVKSRGNKLAVAAVASAVKVSDETIKDLTEIFKLLGDQSRLKIVLALAEEGEMHVGALGEMLNASQPAVSHHLSLMRAHHLVSYRRDGKNNFYRLDSVLLSNLLEQFFSDAGNTHKQLHFDEFSLAYKRK
jgi:ArsR family transcriptional regulator, arsenate/arsenite/antimonite-responsive transcriptional repressor